MITDRYSRPIGRLSQYAAPGACSLLAAITFLGEQEDITDPDAAVGVAGKRPHAFQVGSGPISQRLADHGNCKNSQFRAETLSSLSQSLLRVIPRCFAFTRARQGHER